MSSLVTPEPPRNQRGRQLLNPGKYDYTREEIAEFIKLTSNKWGEETYSADANAIFIMYYDNPYYLQQVRYNPESEEISPCEILSGCPCLFVKPDKSTGLNKLRSNRIYRDHIAGVERKFVAFEGTKKRENELRILDNKNCAKGKECLTIRSMGDEIRASDYKNVQRKTGKKYVRILYNRPSVSSNDLTTGTEFNTWSPSRSILSNCSRNYFEKVDEFAEWACGKYLIENGRMTHQRDRTFVEEVEHMREVRGF